jgi:hypothetical protein
VYTVAELITLARVYIEATGVLVPRLSGAAFGNPKTLARLFDGLDCYAQAAERASAWFDDNWPLHVPWPDGVPRAAGRFRLELRQRYGARAAETMPAGA